MDGGSASPLVSKKEKEEKEEKSREKNRTINGHSCPHGSDEGQKRVKHQLSSATVMVEERELSCTFWRMMSRSGLTKDG